MLSKVKYENIILTMFFTKQVTITAIPGHPVIQVNLPVFAGCTLYLQQCFWERILIGSVAIHFYPHAEEAHFQYLRVTYQAR
jgi:hypothetical protein